MMKKLLSILVLFCAVPAFGQVALNQKGCASASQGFALTVGGCLSPQVFNVKAYGALADTRQVTQNSISASSTTLVNSAGSSPFTAADTGKTVTLSMGTTGVFYSSYVSGITATGTLGQTCSLGSFNGGGSGATGYVILTGTNTIAASYTVIEVAGTGYTSAPTSATATDGTATCSGTATITSALSTQAVQTTATYVDANHLTLGVAATTAITNGTISIGSDDSTAVMAAINAAYNAGGGVVYFPRGYYLILSQILLPNNAALHPVQYPITFQGDGSQWDGTWDPYGSAVAATILDLRYSTANAKILTLGAGVLSSQGIAFTDFGPDTLPFVQTTNTTLKFSGNSFRNGYCLGSTCKQDAFVLGGTTTTIGGDPSDAFQGYGTIISGNFFDRIQTGVHTRAYANGIVIQNNTWSRNCGADNAVGAIFFDGSYGMSMRNVAIGNLIEMSGYTWGVQQIGTAFNMVLGDTFWDGPVNYGADIHDGTGASNTTGWISTDSSVPFIGSTTSAIITASSGYNLNVALAWPNYGSLRNGIFIVGGQTGNSAYPTLQLDSGTSSAFEIQTQYTNEADFAVGGTNAGFAQTTMKMRSDGGIQLVSKTPSCDATHRGTFNYIAGGAGVKDDVQVCVKDATDTYAWATIY